MAKDKNSGFRLMGVSAHEGAIASAACFVHDAFICFNIAAIFACSVFTA